MRTPRDRDASFEPQLGRKGQRRLAGLDDRVLDLYAGGMSTRDLAAHLAGLYGVEVSADTISRVTDAVLDHVQAWRARPLDTVYPIVYFGALQVKVREDRRSDRVPATWRWASPVTVTARRWASGVLERFDDQWGAQYPMITAAWREHWEHIIPFLSLPDALRHAVYTTNTIEGLHRQIRKAIKTRGHFPDEQAATKLIYLAIERAEGKWRSHRAWTAARAALKIHFGDRFPG